VHSWGDVNLPPSLKLLSTYRFDAWEFKGDPPLDGYGISVIPKICASCLPSDIEHAAYVIGSSMRTESRCDVVLLVLKQARRGRPVNFLRECNMCSTDMFCFPVKMNKVNQD
jgi:hypothetical protein